MRHDHAAIKAVAKRYSVEAAQEIQSLPFFYVNEEAEHQFTTDELNEYGYRKVDPRFRTMTDGRIDLDLLPFHEFVVMDSADSSWCAFDFHSDMAFDYYFLLDPNVSEVLNEEHVVGTIVKVSVDLLKVEYVGDKISYEMDSQIRIVELPDEERYEPVIQKLRAVFANKDLSEGIMQVTVRTLEYVLSFFKWAQALHLVEERPEPTKRDAKTAKHGNRKPWTRNDLPRYIYLNAPRRQSEHKSSGKKRGSLRAGHNRRAHWRKLTDKRFQNHPKYGDYIPVKATWVGPKTWRENNTVYTVKTVKTV